MDQEPDRDAPALQEERRAPDADLVFSAETEPEIFAAYAAWRCDRSEERRAPFGQAPKRFRGSAPVAPEHDARKLTGGGVEARILLDGTPYVLRITRLGKLILTK